ncbi:hypothetical protein OROHE_016946 [Orobanche hederae]
MKFTNSSLGMKFDLETTVPKLKGGRFAILEFGAILVCPQKLEELRSYSTLVRPADLSCIDSLSDRRNGITKEAVVTAPTFADIADDVYNLLDGRIWAGHNILRFDCHRIKEAFDEINKPAPKPKGITDSLVLLSKKFGGRAGNMKMANLASYFRLGKQTHRGASSQFINLALIIRTANSIPERSLDDVHMNLKVLKYYCATVLFLLPEKGMMTVEEANSSLIEPNAASVDPFDLSSMRALELTSLSLA